MGGQACVYYAAAEFSRNCDIVIVADNENLARLTAALDELQADCIAVPSMDWTHLDRGHAIHFRCKQPEALGIRLDIMTKMRGCGDFDSLWERVAPHCRKNWTKSKQQKKLPTSSIGARSCQVLI